MSIKRGYKKWDHAWMQSNWMKHHDDELATITGHTEKAVKGYRIKNGWTREGRSDQRSSCRNMFTALDKALEQGIIIHISREKYGNVVRGTKLDPEGNKRASPALVAKFVEALPGKIIELTNALR